MLGLIMYTYILPSYYVVRPDVRAAGNSQCAREEQFHTVVGESTLN